MEFTVTEEFVREAHGAACSTWKQRIEKEFPDLFEKELVVGKWYKNANETIVNYQGGRLGHGFAFGYAWYNNDRWGDFEPQSWKEATHEEVESALIAEAKKMGYKKGVMCNFGPMVRTLESNEIEWDPEWAGKGGLIIGTDVIFTEGKWAEILPEEKTIITKGKALRIIAKKLKVSPESIEIQ